MWNWLIGKPKLTGKLLYDQMIDNADGMLAVMKEDRYDDIIHDVMRFTGVDPYPLRGPAFFACQRPRKGPFCCLKKASLLSHFVLLLLAVTARKIPGNMRSERENPR